MTPCFVVSFWIRELAVLLTGGDVLCSKSRDAAMASMAVKVMQLESLLQDKQAELQRMGDTGQAWVEDACRLRDAVASTLAALGMSAPHHPSMCIFFSQQKHSMSSWDMIQRFVASTLAALDMSTSHPPSLHLLFPQHHGIST